MDVNQIKDLTQSLADYAPKVNEMANLINSTSVKAGQIIILIMLLLEMESWHRYLKQESGGFNNGLFLELFFKFFLAFLAVTYSATIFDAIAELFNIILKALSRLYTSPSFKSDINTDGVEGWVQKNFLGLVSGITEIIVGVSMKLIIFMRAFEMYILKAIAPLLIAFWMADGTRDIAKNLLKQFAAAAFQGIILFVVASVYAAFVTDELFKVSTGKDGWDIAWSSILKSIIFVFTIWKTQQQAKKLFGTS